jgi:hypothetical protein
VADEATTSLTADFSETLVDQGHSHGSLANGSRASLDRATPDIARGE